MIRRLALATVLAVAASAPAAVQVPVLHSPASNWLAVGLGIRF